MAPHLPEDENPSNASDSQRELAGNTDDIAVTTHEVFQAEYNMESNFPTSTRSSLNSDNNNNNNNNGRDSSSSSSSSGGGRIVSIDQDRAAVRFAEDHDNPFATPDSENASSHRILWDPRPSSSSAPSLRDADSIGEAVTTDGLSAIAAGSVPMRDTAPAQSSGGNLCNSSNSSLENNNENIGRSVSSAEPRAFPLTSRHQASVRASPPVSLRQDRRRSSTIDPFSSSDSTPERDWQRRRSSTVEDINSNGPTNGPSTSTIPSIATRPARLTYASNMPTPIVEEPNPMEQAFGSVRFNPMASTDPAECRSGQPALGHQTRNGSLAAGSTGQRRRSSFAGFLTRGSSERRESQIDPADASERTVSTGAIPTLRDNNEDKQRSQSFAAPPTFKHPFQKRDGKAVNLDRSRRGSEPNQRRPSTFQRMKSVSELLVNDNPIPQRYRSRSVSSVAFFVTPMKRNNSVNPIFQENIVAEKENVREFLEAAKEVQQRQSRNRWQKEIFRCAYLVALVALVYFVFIGKPLWQGVGSIYYNFIHTSTTSRIGIVGVFIGWAAIQGCVPLIFANFEAEVDDVESRDASETALIIPAYKAANVLPETITAALQIFRKEQIFVIANGNNPTPMDNTADVCKEFGVNHAWVPIGSKIVAEFVGVALTHKFKYIMLIDDDVHLPANLPLVTNRMTGNTKCVGYTIKSTGANGIKGTLIQQCQDMEYKASGLGRTFAGKYGSATFPHGAIILWERECLQNLFNVHPGFTISEDWYFGHCARASGCRIQFCSQVFVETETPPALFKSSNAARGGFGEMTVFKQRFYRWNYFFVHRIYDDGAYLLLSWRLGWRELVTKFYVLIELYDSCMAILRPWIVILTLVGDAKLFFIMAAGLTAMYCLIFIWFNAWHLRKKNEMIQWRVLPVYLGMKFVLLWVTCASVYYAMIHYAIFFMAKHPRVIESTQALEAAYNVRLGTMLVPLNRPSSDVLGMQETITRLSLSQTDAESMPEKQ